MLMYGITPATRSAQSKSFNRRTEFSTGIVLQLNATRQRLRARYSLSSTHERIQRAHARPYKTSLRQEQHTLCWVLACWTKALHTGLVKRLLNRYAKPHTHKRH